MLHNMTFRSNTSSAATDGIMPLSRATDTNDTPSHPEIYQVQSSQFQVHSCPRKRSTKSSGGPDNILPMLHKNCASVLASPPTSVFQCPFDSEYLSDICHANIQKVKLVSLKTTDKFHLHAHAVHVRDHALAPSYFCYLSMTLIVLYKVTLPLVHVNFMQMTSNFTVLYLAEWV